MVRIMKKEVPSRMLGFLIMLCASLAAFGQESPILKISRATIFTIPGSEDIVSFQLTSLNQDAVWMLQSSANGKDWDDLVFLEDKSGVVGFERRAILGEGFEKMFFRAVKVDEPDQTYRAYLDGLLRWRERAYEDYTFVVRSNQGMTSYETLYTVEGGVVTGMEKISSFPDFVEPPTEQTIESLFARVGSAIDRDAVTIDVDWSSANGFPVQGFIDLDLLLADEEQSWSVVEFIPTTPESTEFLAARQRWRDAGLTNYSYVTETYNQLGVLKVRHTVVNGEATTAEILARPEFPVNDPEPKTMDEWFDEILDAFEDGAADVSVDYNELNGYPTRASIDFIVFLAGEERYWQITEFLGSE